MTDRVDVHVSEVAYLDHCLPVLRALPEELQGTVFAPRELRGLIDGPVIWSTPPSSGMPLIVAGYQDLRYARRPKILVNHGAGQTYEGIDSPSYAGGPGRDAADLILHPNERAAALDRERYPHARSVAVGCAKLDLWKMIPRPRNDPPVVAVTFHWDCFAVPEARSAWAEWRDRIEQLSIHATVLGHCHPRAAREIGPWWQSIGVEYVPRAVDLLARADVLVLDNSSLGFEWAACDRPTVWLDSTHYRRDVQHGLRFWDELPGPSLWPAAPLAELVSGINSSLQRFTLARGEVRRRVYGHDDHNASKRAAAAVLELIEHGPNPRTYAPARPCANC